MKSVLGICNLHDSPSLGALTDNHPLGAISFLGRYGLMDFTLSNFSNSGIDRVYILVENKSHAVKTHVQDGHVWINNTKTGFQRILLNEKAVNNPLFNTDVANIRENKQFFDEIKADIVVIAPAFYLSSMDFRPLIEKHVASGAELSVVYKKVNEEKADFVDCDTVLLNGDNVKAFGTCNKRKGEANISLETFILNRACFERLVESSKSVSELFGFRKLIPYLLEQGEVMVNGIEFTGCVIPIISFDSYVKQSFNLLSYLNRQKLFLEDWPIYTTTHNTSPSLYGKKAQVKNSFVANGSIINGKVENSIISRDVVIEEGTEVIDSIIFSHSEIGKNIVIEKAVLDKNVKVFAAKEVNKGGKRVVYIPQGANL